MTTRTFDLAPPRRPTLDDVGGAGFTNDPDFPPSPAEPDADGYNQTGMLAVAAAGMVPVRGVSVRFQAGVPLVDLQADMRSTPAVLTLTDNGAGDTTITYPSGSYPAPVLRAAAFLNEDVAALAPTVTIVTNGFRVRTRNSAGTLTDIAFTLCWW